MSWIAAAVVGGTVGGALITSNSMGKAADQQAQGTSAALSENARQYDQTRADYTPYREAGTKALDMFARENDTPFDQSQVQLDPGYQFGLNQGQQAINRQTSAAGGRISGAALKAAAQYGTDYATSGYSAAYNRANQARTDRLNRLATLAGIGQTSTQQVSSLGAQTTASNNALVQAAGNNAGAATLAQGNIWGNAGNQLAAMYGRSGGAGSAAGGYNDEMSRINAQLMGGG
ncbi:MAG: Rhodoferax phage [Pseudomonadota bacterium]|jgi:hypothetical protein